MAVPKEMTTLDISGRYIMNKDLSEDYAEILELQSVGWFVRKAIGMATITLDIKHYKSDEGVEKIDIVQTLTGGIKGTTECRNLDYVERGHKDHIFGNVVGRTRRIMLEDIEDEYLKKDWPADLVKEGLIDSFVFNEENAWTANQIWGFEMVNGEKRYVRHVKFEKDGVKTLTRKLIYNYIGPVPASA